MCRTRSEFTRDLNNLSINIRALFNRIGESGDQT